MRNGGKRKIHNLTYYLVLLLSMFSCTMSKQYSHISEKLYQNNGNVSIIDCGGENFILFSIKEDSSVDLRVKGSVISKGFSKKKSSKSFGFEKEKFIKELDELDYKVNLKKMKLDQMSMTVKYNSEGKVVLNTFPYSYVFKQKENTEVLKKLFLLLQENEILPVPLTD